MFGDAAEAVEEAAILRRDRDRRDAIVEIVDQRTRA